MKQTESDWSPRQVSHEDICILASKLNSLGVEYLIFGSSAMRIHGVTRPTEDIDVYLKRSEKSIAGVVQAISETGWFPDVSEEELRQLITDGAFAYGVIKFQGEIGIDIVTSMGENDIDSLDGEVVEFGGVPIRVITLDQLLVMKKGSLRERDQQDYQELRNRMKKKKPLPKSSIWSKLNIFGGK